jgi:hypothetical protein
MPRHVSCFNGAASAVTAQPATELLPAMPEQHLMVGRNLKILSVCASWTFDSERFLAQVYREQPMTRTPSQSPNQALGLESGATANWRTYAAGAGCCRQHFWSAFLWAEGHMFKRGNICSDL